MSVPTDPVDVLGPAELLSFATALADSPDGLPEGVRAGGERRVFEVLWSDEYVNAWAIWWPGDSDTGFHDHDLSAAAVVVVQGSVVEERLALAQAPLARRFAAGDAFTDPAVGDPPCAPRRRRAGAGVHAYSPPLRSQGVYRTAANGALEREAIPHTETLRAEPGGLRR